GGGVGFTVTCVGGGLWGAWITVTGGVGGAFCRVVVVASVPVYRIRASPIMNRTMNPTRAPSLAACVPTSKQTPSPAPHRASTPSPKAIRMTDTTTSPIPRPEYGWLTFTRCVVVLD